MNSPRIVIGGVVAALAFTALPVAASSVASSAAPAVVREAARTVATPKAEAFWWCPGWFCRCPCGKPR